MSFLYNDVWSFLWFLHCFGVLIYFLLTHFILSLSLSFFHTFYGLFLYSIITWWLIEINWIRDHVNQKFIFGWTKIVLKVWDYYLLISIRYIIIHRNEYKWRDFNFNLRKMCKTLKVFINIQYIYKFVRK